MNWQLTTALVQSNEVQWIGKLFACEHQFIHAKFITYGLFYLYMAEDLKLQ